MHQYWCIMMQTTNFRKGTAAGSVLAALAVLLFAAATFSGTATAAGNNETADVNVEVGTQTAIDLSPAVYNWTTGGELATTPVLPGDAGEWTNETRGQIENIGSTNLSRVWFNASQPQTRDPFGTGSRQYYDPGNFLTVSTRQDRDIETLQRDLFYFADRLEWNATTELVYVEDPDDNQPPNTDNWVYGRFRNASQEYFWMVGVSGGISSATDCTGLTFYDGDVAHTKEQTGSVDFSGGDPVTSSAVKTGASATDCLVEGVTLGTNGNQNYTVAFDYDELNQGTSGPDASFNLRLTRWNPDVLATSNTEANFAVDYFWEEPQSAP